MQTVTHAMPAPRRAQRRLTGFLLALAFQAAFIAALIYGLQINVWPKPHDGIETKFIPTHTRVDYPPPPANPVWLEPKPPTAEQPRIIFETGEDGGTGITWKPGNTYQPGPADHGPVSVAATHTTPPYPPIELRLGAQGVVMLRLTVSPQGTVTDVVVIRSSGHEALDQTARTWVLTHWRYQPAIRGGVAVPSTVTVGVEFNLRNAG
jgi:protein TonB